MKLRPHSGYCNAVIDGNEFDQWEITAESSSAPHMADRALITIWDNSLTPYIFYEGRRGQLSKATFNLSCQIRY